MFLTLIAVFAAGFGGAGLAMALRFTFRGRLPASITPIFAGGAMLIATISTEYGWYANQTANLPDGMEVYVTRERTSWWQPWSYVWPYTDSFFAVDHNSVLTHDDLPDVQLVQIYNFGRWAAITEVPMAVDCAVGAQLNLIDIPDLSIEFLSGDAPWQALPADDPLRDAVCLEEAS